MIYLRDQLPDIGKPTNIFTELVELNDLSAEGIVVNCYHPPLTHDFLSKTLNGIKCDGASVVSGCKTAVVCRFQAVFPNIAIWHCSAHRLELAVGDEVKENEGNELL